jgi:hypothetical protein
MSLYYCKVRGHSPATAWEMGLYMASDTLSAVGAFNTFSAWCQSFFNAGSLHAFGFTKYQTSSQGADWIDVYTVDELTDRKTRYREAVFSTSGTSAIASLPPQCSILALIRPAITSLRAIGRLYMPPFSANAISAGALSGAAQGEITDFLHDAFAWLPLNGAQVVIRNRKDHISTPATTCALSATIATHRSRITPVRPLLTTITL